LNQVVKRVNLENSLAKLHAHEQESVRHMVGALSEKFCCETAMSNLATEVQKSSARSDKIETLTQQMRSPETQLQATKGLRTLLANETNLSSADEHNIAEAIPAMIESLDHDNAPELQSEGVKALLCASAAVQVASIRAMAMLPLTLLSGRSSAQASVRLQASQALVAMHTKAAAEAENAVTVSLAKVQEVERSGKQTQAPKDGVWQALSWMGSSTPVLKDMTRNLLQHAQGASELEKIKSLQSGQVSGAVHAAVPEIIRSLERAVFELNQQEHADSVALHSKFAADKHGFTYVYGSMKMFQAGLEGYVGPPNPDIRSAMEREHLNSAFSTLGFQCWGVFHSEKKTTAKVQWEYIVNGPAKQDGKREEGYDGWKLQHFIVRNGKGCVAIHAPVKVMGIPGCQRSDGVLHSSLHEGRFDASKEYIVVHDGTRTQFIGAQLQLQDTAEMNASEWATVHGGSGRLRHTPVTITSGSSSTHVQHGQLLDKVSFIGGKFAAGLDLESAKQYTVKVGRDVFSVLGENLHYAVKFDPATAYDIELHGRPNNVGAEVQVVTVTGEYLVWKDLVFRADLQEAEIIAGRLYTGPMYMWYNHVLRWFHKAAPFDDDFLKKGESWGNCKEQKHWPEHWRTVKITGGNADGQYGKLKQPPPEKFEEQTRYDVVTSEGTAEEQNHQAEGKYLSKVEMHELPFVTTIHVLNSLILKLSRNQAAENVYRGAKVLFDI
jgi:hypothetical protein